MKLTIPSCNILLPDVVNALIMQWKAMLYKKIRFVIYLFCPDLHKFTPPVWNIKLQFVQKGFQI